MYCTYTYLLTSTTVPFEFNRFESSYVLGIYVRTKREYSTVPYVHILPTKAYAALTIKQNNQNSDVILPVAFVLSYQVKIHGRLSDVRAIFLKISRTKISQRSPTMAVFLFSTIVNNHRELGRRDEEKKAVGIGQYMKQKYKEGK